MLEKHINAVDQMQKVADYDKNSSAYKTAASNLKTENSNLKKYIHDMYEQTYKEVKNIQVSKLKDPYTDEEIKKKIKKRLKDDYHSMVGSTFWY